MYNEVQNLKQKMVSVINECQDVLTGLNELQKQIPQPEFPKVINWEKGGYTNLYENEWFKFQYTGDYGMEIEWFCLKEFGEDFISYTMYRDGRFAIQPNVGSYSSLGENDCKEVTIVARTKTKEIRIMTINIS